VLANFIERYIPFAFFWNITLRDGMTAEAKTMFSGEYRRLHATCLAMAEQSNSPEARARWLALAKDCENLVKGDQSKLRATRLTTRRSFGLRSANVL
jgi:hypothetical protein